MIERTGEGNQAVTRDAAVGGFQTDTTAKRRGLADGAAGVRAERGDDFVRRDRRCRAAGRAAGNARGIPRISGNAERRIFRRAAHGKLVHVQPAKNDSARCF